MIDEHLVDVGVPFAGLSVALDDDVAGRVGPCRLVPLSSQVKRKVRTGKPLTSMFGHLVDVRAVCRPLCRAG